MQVEHPGHPEPLRLTYAQLGHKLGISTEAARMLARRRRWTRVAPNHPGAPTTVLVQADALDREDWRSELPPDHPDSPVELETDQTDTADPRVEQAEQRAVDAERRADALLTLADRLGAQLADASERTDRLVQDLAAAMTATDHARATAQTTQDALLERERADMARRLRPLLARLLDAWRAR
jgi:hypothetical protein